MKTLKDYEYFRTENGVLYCGDNLEILNLLKDNNNDRFDLCLTSPPYDNLRDYNGYSFDFESLASRLIFNISKGGVIVWIVADATINKSETGTSFKQALYFKQLGLNIHDTMIWKKNRPPMNDNRYEDCFEYMFVFSNEYVKTYNPIKDKKNKSYGITVHATHRQKTGETKHNNTTFKKDKIKEFGNRVNVWEINPVMSNTERTGHPAQFPIDLAQDHIISWTNENDLVLDCFMGSGTTALACEKLNRKWIGIEISEKYCEIAKKRIEEYTNQLKLFK